MGGITLPTALPTSAVFSDPSLGPNRPAEGRFGLQANPNANPNTGRRNEPFGPAGLFVPGQPLQQNLYTADPLPALLPPSSYSVAGVPYAKSIGIQQQADRLNRLQPLLLPPEPLVAPAGHLPQPNPPELPPLPPMAVENASTSHAVAMAAAKPVPDLLPPPPPQALAPHLYRPNDGRHHYYHQQINQLTPGGAPQSGNPLPAPATPPTPPQPAGPNGLPPGLNQPGASSLGAPPGLTPPTPTPPVPANTPQQAQSPPTPPPGPAHGLNDSSIRALNRRLEDPNMLTRSDAATDFFNLLEGNPGLIDDPRYKPYIEAFLLKILRDPSAIVHQPALLAFQVGLVKHPSPELLQELNNLEKSNGLLDLEPGMARDALSTVSSFMNANGYGSLGTGGAGISGAHALPGGLEGAELGGVNPFAIDEKSGTLMNGNRPDSNSRPQASTPGNLASNPASNPLAGAGSNLSGDIPPHPNSLEGLLAASTAPLNLPGAPAGASTVPATPPGGLPANWGPVPSMGAPGTTPGNNISGTGADLQSLMQQMGETPPMPGGATAPTALPPTPPGRRLNVMSPSGVPQNAPSFVR